MTTAAAAARRDFIAGLVLAVLGAATIAEASRYDVGRFEHVGPGFFPTLLGGMLILLGLAIIAVRNGRGREQGHDEGVQHAPDWRGWTCIIGGVALFIVLGEHAGLAPATFACVFVSALGDRTSKPIPSLVLAAACTMFAAVVFSGLLHFQLPLLRW